MIESAHPVVQGLLGTVFTWFVTAVGAAIVFLIPSNLSENTERKVLDFSLGFAGGVMLAASFWSLLDPALELAESSWGKSASIVPVGIGFIFGAFFVYLSDLFLPDSNQLMIDQNSEEKEFENSKDKKMPLASSEQSTRRIMLLLIAVVIHNFPEGLAVGVAFGAIGISKSATFEKAVTIAIGIGLQNAPEGLAVSLPLRRLGWSRSRSFFYGQLSGMVEPLGGLLGAGAVTFAAPVLPYALAFAAGAMIYVVADSVVPESHAGGNGALASWGCMLGFVVMMSMDVTLG